MNGCLWQLYTCFLVLRKGHQIQPPEWVVAHDMDFLVSHGRDINSGELKELDVLAAFEQKQEPESAFMKVLTTIITEATFLLHIQCIPLRSTVLMITSHEWVLLQHECGCYTLLGCYRCFKPSLKSWTVDLGLIFWLWTMTNACPEWQVSPIADGNLACRGTAVNLSTHQCFRGWGS